MTAPEVHLTHDSEEFAQRCEELRSEGWLPVERDALKGATGYAMYKRQGRGPLGKFRRLNYAIVTVPV